MPRGRIERAMKDKSEKTEASTKAAHHTPDSPAEALASLSAELERMEASTLPFYNLDATYCASVVHASMARAEPYLDAVCSLPTINEKSIRRLPIFAQALVQAHTLVLAHSPAVSAFDADITAAKSLKDELLIVADLCVKRELIPHKSIDDVREGQGNRDLINDIRALRALLTPHAHGVLTEQQLQSVDALADRLTKALSLRDADDPALAALLVQRKKIGALVVQGYSELVAALTFLRRNEGDAAVIAPSIRVPAGRPKGERAEEEKPVPAPTPAPAPKPAPVDPADDPSDRPFDDGKR